jgi:hypothetical protein
MTREQIERLKNSPEFQAAFAQWAAGITEDPSTHVPISIDPETGRIVDGAGNVIYSGVDYAELVAERETFEVGDDVRIELSDGPTYGTVTAVSGHTATVTSTAGKSVQGVPFEKLAPWQAFPDGWEQEAERQAAEWEAEQNEQEYAKWVAWQEERERIAALLSDEERAAGFISLPDLLDMPKAEWLVDGLIRQQSMALMFGAPDTLKTFLALDLSASVILREPWLGHEIYTSGPVLYVAAEGSETLIERLQAWSVQHDRPLEDLERGFFTLRAGFDKGSEESDDAYMARLCEALTVQPYSLVVIDTFGKSLGRLGGVDENSNSDVNRALMTIGKVKELGIAVLLIHHTGKKGGTPRGASALFGGIDTSIRVKRTPGAYIATLSCDRQKRGKPFDPFRANFVEHVIGQDSRGRDETSLAVVGVSSMDTADRVLEIIREHEWEYTKTELIKAVGGRAEVARFKVSKLEEDGTIVTRSEARQRKDGKPLSVVVYGSLSPPDTP